MYVVREYIHATHVMRTPYQYIVFFASISLFLETSGG